MYHAYLTSHAGFFFFLCQTSNLFSLARQMILEPIPGLECTKSLFFFLENLIETRGKSFVIMSDRRAFPRSISEGFSRQRFALSELSLCVLASDEFLKECCSGLVIPILDLTEMKVRWNIISRRRCLHRSCALLTKTMTMVGTNGGRRSDISSRHLTRKLVGTSQ